VKELSETLREMNSHLAEAAETAADLVNLPTLERMAENFA
jgi:hypothetical protein